MKKFFYSAFLLVASAAFVTSCQKDVQPVVQQSLESKLAQDASFAKLMESTVTLATTFSGEGLENGSDAVKVLEIINKGKDATAAEQEFVAVRLGESADRFVGDFGAFLNSVAELEKKYELSKLSAKEIETAISGALKLNPELQQRMSAIAAVNGKAGSVGAGVCRLVVSLAGLFGGGALCTAIGVTTIPVIGGVLCTVVTTLATNILNAACDLIP